LHGTIIHHSVVNLVYINLLQLGTAPLESIRIMISKVGAVVWEAHSFKMFKVAFCKDVSKTCNFRKGIKEDAAQPWTAFQHSLQSLTVEIVTICQIYDFQVDEIPLKRVPVCSSPRNTCAVRQDCRDLWPP
jgi:hypothetical protein